MVEAAIIGGLLTNLTPLIRDEFSLFLSFKKDIQKLSSRLTSLHAVLEDAEKIKLEKKDKQTEDWLRKLKDVAYEVRDIMDEYTFEDLRLQVKRMNASSSTRIQVTNCITHHFRNIWTRLKIGHKIKGVLEKLDQISSERNNLHLRETTRDSKSSYWRETKSKPSENVYGRDIEKKKIVDVLVHTSLDTTKNLFVLPIIGPGGLGKTTLAQMVFNDEEITKYFDVKLWVCVSEEFDIKLVIKAILGVTNATSLEMLQNEIQDKLRGKKYLIVLDDVWNENPEEWNKLRSILDCGLNGSFILTTTRKKNVAEIMKTQVQPFELLPLSDDDCWKLFEERAFMYGIPKTKNYIGIGKEIVKKCKGVPLIAKTLGGQLGFKRGEKDWCTIKDNEIWKISENEASILPILRLSYYDLSYLLRGCFAFCAIFPKDTKIEKEDLIQMWMANDLIPTNENQEVEDVGNQIWDELCWRSFFQDENEEINQYGKYYQTCKMHDFMHDLAQSIMKDECYIMVAKGSNEDFRPEIRHLRTTVNSYKKTSIEDSLKKIGGLQSLILYGTFSKENCSFLKEQSSLRVIETLGNMQNQDLVYLGGLKHLRYLNLSCYRITSLPNSICGLLNLQTLNLNECFNLESLPRNTKDLINLRHLHLKGCYRLKYMPKEMRRLKHLKTLSMFVIGKESDGQLDELKELDIGGFIEIKNLERVSDACVASGGINMSQKSNINHLVLEWNVSRPFNDDNLNKTRDEKICEALEVSTRRLKILGMRGYKGVNIPKWVGESSASLTRLHLVDLDNVEHVFTINNINTGDMNGTLFPLLQELSISNMKNLRELVSPPITTIITGAFPNLGKIEISGCPKLGALPRHLKSLKDVTVDGECSDELLDSISDLSGRLTHLSISHVNERSVLFSAAAFCSNAVNGTVVTLFPFLEELTIWDMKNLRELVSPPIPTTIVAFPNLRKIEIHRCPMLGALPPHLKSLKDLTVRGECLDELFDSISYLSGLTHLRVNFIDNERSVLFGAGASSNDMNGALFPLLQELSISNMKNLRELESPGPNLRKIQIDDCPKLGALPPYLKSLKYVAVRGECSDELLYSISNLTALTHLTLWELGERSVLFGGGGNYYYKEDNEAEGGPPASSTFQSLQCLEIRNCSKLSRLFDDEEKKGCEKLARGGGGGGGGSCLTNLNSLSIWNCPELMISVEQWRNLITHSLQRFHIFGCPKLVPSSKVEEEEAYDDDVIAFLRSLRERLGTDNFDGDILDKEDERSEKKKKKSLSILCY